MKEKLKTTSFWLGVASSVVLIVECVAKIFNFSICAEHIENVILTICSILVMLGFITKKNVNDVGTCKKDDLLLELKAEELAKKEDNSNKCD